jgi:predicted transposase/invertase (TIGR01784 family)
MSQYLDPKADIVLKKIFGDHPHLLMSFLNAVLPLEPNQLNVPEIAEAITLAKESGYTESELTVYESYWDQVSREKTLISDKYREGKAEGEEIATHRIAKSLLKSGVPIALVIESTGLTREEIEKIASRCRVI